MKVSDMFPNKWAKPVEDLTHGLLITIDGDVEKRDGKDFNGDPAVLFDLPITYDSNGEVEEKLMQLNAGNAKSIAEAYGDDTGKWKGKQMVCMLVASPNSKSGKRVILTSPSELPEVEATK